MNIKKPSYEPVSTTEVELLHAPFIPVDVREGELVSAIARIHSPSGEPSKIPMQVWRLSPYGIELVAKENDSSLTNGTVLDLTVTIGESISNLHGLIVATNHVERDRVLVGIRLHQPPEARLADTERRSGERWICSKEFYPTGVTINPARYNDYIHFRVHNISADGMKIITSMRNKYLIQGMVLDCMLSFPSIGNINIELEIVNCQIHNENGKDYYAIGTRIRRIAPQAREIVGQYLLQFGPPVSPDKLVASGLRLQSSSKVIDFTYVRSDDEYQEVLQLRKLAYARARKVSKDTSPEVLSDVYDSRSRILIGRYRGTIVATARIVFPDINDPLEHEEDITIPKDFPRRDQLVEMSRVCTHPDYRGSDLLFGLFHHALLTILQSRRRWILASSITKLWPLYDKMGFKKTGLSYNNRLFGNLHHDVFLGDAVGALAGRNVSPLFWNLFYSHVWQFVDAHGIIGVDPLVNFRIGMYRLLAPISHMIARRMLKPRLYRKV